MTAVEVTPGAGTLLSKLTPSLLRHPLPIPPNPHLSTRPHSPSFLSGACKRNKQEACRFTLKRQEGLLVEGPGAGLEVVPAVFNCVVGYQAGTPLNG